MEKIFFSTKFLHKSLKGGCAVNILNSEDISQIKSLNSLLESEGEEVIAQTKETYNIKDKGMLSSYRDAKKGTAATIQKIENVCDFVEKTRNLIQWEDLHMTRIFLLLLVVLFIFVTFLPLRFILTLSTAYKFWKGLQWQKKRRVNNEEVCRIEMQNFLLENKITTVTDYNERWEP